MSDERLNAESVSVTPPVTVFTAPNPGLKTLDGTRTYVIGLTRAYILDPGPDIESYQRSLAQWLEGKGAAVTAILLSHGHPDHAPGALLLSDLLSAPILGSSRIADEWRLSVRIDQVLDDGDRFDIDDDVVQAVASPGHSADHISFFLRRSRILFSGDTVLGRGTTVIAPPEGNMVDYMRTLHRLRSLEPALIAPGHGPIVPNATEILDSYIRHREQREAQVLDALGVAMRVDEIVGLLYHDVDPSLHGLAAASVMGHLEKLEAEGRVSHDGERYRRIDP